MTDIVPAATPNTEHPHAALIAGLRQIADLYEQHPEMPAPRYPVWQHCVLAPDDATGIAEIGRVAAVLNAPVAASRDRVGAEAAFGPIRMRAWYNTERAMAEHHARMSYDRVIDVSAVTPC